MVLSVPPPVQSKVVSALLDQIAAELSQDQNLVRIKKLLLYVCTGTWENDRQRLTRAPLNALLQHLFEVAPTFEQLQHQLNQVVASLNKSAEYTIVANGVISRLHAVYAKVEQQPTANQAFYDTVAERLQQEPDLIRIKKLLLLTCRSTWENNSGKLAQLDLLDLVRELHQIAPTTELEASLTQVAKALSKPDEYTKIAVTIGRAFQGFDADEKTELSNITRWLPESIPPNVTSVMGAPLQSNCALPSLPQHGDQSTELKPVGIRLAQSISQSAPQYIHQTVQQPILGAVTSSISLSVEQPPSPEQKVLVLAQPQKIVELFNLRLEIMQDTNPLRAKILLFSVLHERFEGSSEHDAFLRTHELDDLLRVFFLSYRLYSEAENQLRQIAKALAVGDYLQVAEAIIRAIQPFYTEAESAASSGTVTPMMTTPITPTEITSMKADTNEVTTPEYY
jgi:hypothetical protein